MSKTYTTLLVWIPLLILAQALIFNHVCFLGFAVPIVFIYGLLRLPLNMSKEWLFTIGFLVGLILDIFSDTLGVNALCCTILMALRKPILRLYVPHDDDILGLIPSIRSFGLGVYIKYILTACLLYCSLIFLVESLTNFHLWKLCGKVLASTALSVVIQIGIDSLTISKREKRL